MTQVMFLIPHPNRASSRLRVLNAIPALDQMGFNTVVRMFPQDRNVAGFLRLLLDVKRADVVLLQKKIHFAQWKKLALRRLARRIVFDYDDAVMFVELTQGRGLTGRNLVHFCSVMELSDVIIAGNPFLADFAIANGKPVHILPTPVDLSRYSGKSTPLDGKPGVFRVGWVGSRGNLSELETVASSLRRLSRERSVELCVICDETVAMQGVDVRWLRWSLEEEYSHIDVIDVGIMPMAGDDLWRRGKCAFKLLQYMARGKPVVASGVGFNRVVVTHGVNGFLAESSEQFYDFLHYLASDPDEARRMGERGAHRVAQEYMLERYVQSLARILVG